MHLQKTGTFISGLIATASVFLPWEKTIFNGDVSFTPGRESQGWVILICCGIIFLLLLIYRKKYPLKRFAVWSNATIGALMVAFTVMKFKNIFEKEVVDIPQQLFHLETKPGFGLYTLMIASLSLLVLPFISNKKSNK